MISTQRLLLLTILLNIVIGISAAIYTGISGGDQYTEITNLITNQSNQLDNNQADILSNESIYGGITTENPVQENTILNTLIWGKRVIKAFGLSFIPWAIQSDTQWTNFEILIWNLINWFRVLLLILVIIEIYFIWRNKKNT